MQNIILFASSFFLKTTELLLEVGNVLNFNISSSLFSAVLTFLPERFFPGVKNSKETFLVKFCEKESKYIRTDRDGKLEIWVYLSRLLCNLSNLNITEENVLKAYFINTCSLLSIPVQEGI